TEEDRACLGYLEGILTAWVHGMQARGHKSPSSLAMEAFLLVAREPGLSVTEYAKRLKAPKSTVSRDLLDLGDRNRKGEPGVGLVTSRPNRFDPRQLEYRLTPRGRALVKQIGLAFRQMERELGWDDRS